MRGALIALAAASLSTVHAQSTSPAPQGQTPQAQSPDPSAWPRRRPRTPPAPTPPTASAPSAEEEHLLGRLGYGFDAWSLARLRQVGYRTYVEEQLHPERVDDSALAQRLSDPTLAALRADYATLYDQIGYEGFRASQVELLLRATYSHRQLETLLTEFWFNHFNVYADGAVARHMQAYVRDTLRPRVLGRFEDLLLAVAKAPAMLHYLDNASNYRPGFRQGSRELGLNENFAREVMELHTFGVDDQAGVYTQDDVIALARCLTGLTLDRSQGSLTGYRFWSEAHDTGAKRVLQLVVPAGGGEADADQALRYLARHPRTAAFLSSKLVTFFVGPGHPSLVEVATKLYLRTQGDLRAVLRLILLSPQLDRARDAKVKRPLLLLVSAMRATQVEVGSGQQAYDQLKGVTYHLLLAGQPIFQVAPPTGWDDEDATWTSEGHLLTRVNLIASFLGAPGRFADLGYRPTGDDASLVTQLYADLLGQRVATPPAWLLDYLRSTTHVSEDDRRRAAISLVLSTPEFNRY